MGSADDVTDALRDQLVDRLVREASVRTPAVEAALRAVPRHEFVPEVDPEVAYEDRPQLVKRGPTGTLSTISQPTMVAIMMELTELGPGQRVLEIGTGTGYNAALLGHLVGPGGTVVSVDVEADLVERAATLLAELGLDQVSVHVGDGREGWGPDAPYDCVIATAGVDTVPPAWRDQTVVGGRLLVPMLGPQTLLVEVREGEETWRTEATSPAAFIPLR